MKTTLRWQHCGTAKKDESVVNYLVVNHDDTWRFPTLISNLIQSPSISLHLGGIKSSLLLAGLACHFEEKKPPNYPLEEFVA